MSEYSETVDKIAWIPEHPSLPAWRAKDPERTGYFGEVEHLLTFSAHHALHFATREECEAWIAENPVPVFRATEHMFVHENAAIAKAGR